MSGALRCPSNSPHPTVGYLSLRLTKDFWAIEIDVGSSTYNGQLITEAMEMKGTTQDEAAEERKI